MFAFWVARGGRSGRAGRGSGLKPAAGLASAAKLARTHGPRLGLDFSTCYDYLTRSLSYDLGEPEIAGLRRFATMAAYLGLAPEGVSLVFHRRRNLHRTINGERLSLSDGVDLFRSGSLLELGRAADQVCRRLHPGPFRTYNIDRNINYTNVSPRSAISAGFYRKAEDSEGMCSTAKSCSKNSGDGRLGGIRS